MVDQKCVLFVIQLRLTFVLGDTYTHRGKMWNKVVYSGLKGMLSIMLRGASVISLDTKGRLSLPKRYREELAMLCNGLFVCTIDHQFPCLLLYPLPEWERIETKLSRLSSLHPAERRLQRLLLGHAFECEMDGQGRLLISSALRCHADLNNKIMLVGQLNKFELWNHAHWQKQIDQDIQLQANSAEILSDKLDHFSL